MILTADQVCSSRVVLVCGHYGTGKTEFAVNYALALAHAGHATMLADVDIVNPYFRSRERRKLMEEAGIRVISSSQACSDADVPALPAEILTILENRDIRGVMDVGGDPVGARVLARFQPKIIQEDYDLLFVLNANRPEVRAVESALLYLRSIETVTGLTCGGIVNNTHLCGETTPHEILKGAELAEAVSKEAGIPVVCHMAERRFTGEGSLSGLKLFPVDIYMKKPWEL
ncbi:hypothetical protein OBV_37990 [Oscillibacter valericigenes Sjm18-20]|nr:hypothetical protein OBV_37990 [Oscillibacter valericigenes Sjm18-20]